jgi:hypothetical protein
MTTQEVKTHLRRLEQGARPRRLGLLEGQCQVRDDFDGMAGEEIAALFEGG